MPLLLLLIKATALLAAALGVTLIMHRASAGSRHLVWLVAFASLILLPLLAAWSPLHIAVLPAHAPTRVAASRSQLPNSGGAIIDAESHGTVGESVTDGSPVATPPRVTIATIASGFLEGTRLLLIIWAAIAAALLMWLGYGAMMVHRIVRRSRALSDPAWRGPLYEIADRLGLDAAPRLVRSEDVKMPFACGLVDCIVVLPAESDEWSAERRNAVLIHELGHVRRRDLAGHTLSRIACAFYWFHPLVWTAAKKLRAESERACDDLALTLGERPSDYAEHLLDIVTCVRDHATPSIALAMAHRKEFEGRMLAILDPELRRSTPTRGQALSLVSALTVLAVVISAAAPVARATPVVPLPTGMVNMQPPSAPSDTAPGLAADTRTAKPVTNPAAPARQAPVAAPAAMPAATEIFHNADSVSRALALATMLRTDSAANVRRIAAWGLRNFEEVPAVRDALIHALGNDGDAAVREMSAWSLAEFDAAAARAALGTAARVDRSERVREMAVWAIGQRGENSDAHLLADALVDARPSVRATAAWGLGQMSLTRAPQALLTALSDSSQDVRTKAAWATVQIEDSMALPALRQSLRKEKSTEVQKALVRALMACGEDPEKMVEWLRSPDAELRELAARSMAGGERGSPWPWPWPRPIPRP